VRPAGRDPPLAERQKQLNFKIVIINKYKEDEKIVKVLYRSAYPVGAEK